MRAWILVHFCLELIISNAQDNSSSLGERPADDDTDGGTRVEPVVELGLYVTSDIQNDFYDKLKIDRLPGGDIFQSTLLTNYIKGLNELFGSAELEDSKIKVVISVFETVPERIWRSWTGLDDFCRYQSNLSQSDAAILIIQRNGAAARHFEVSAYGMAYRKGVCQSRWRCALIQENFLLYSGSRRLIVHELGHILGLIDQGRLLQRKLFGSKKALTLAAAYRKPYDDLKCLTLRRGMMAARGEQWLSCSRRALAHLLNSSSSWCLAEQSGTSVLPDGTFVGMMRYIGRREMCSLYMNTTRGNYKMKYNDNKDNPLCRFGRGECSGFLDIGLRLKRILHFDNQSWPTGTRCSKYVFNQFCYHGECLPHHEIMKMTKLLVNNSNKWTLNKTNSEPKDV